MVSWSAVATIVLLAVGLHIHLFLPNLGDMGVQKLTKWRLLIPYRPPSRKIIHVSRSICKCQPAHQILTYSLISCGHMEGILKYKQEANQRLDGRT